MRTITSKLQSTTGCCAALVLSALFLGASIPDAQAKQRPSAAQIIPTITDVGLNEDGDLVASGRAIVENKGKTQTIEFSDVPINLALAEDQTGSGTCPILDLTLGPIDLNVLGLIVETSEICLKIKAVDGGGLLGDLLCDIGGLLNAGTPLDPMADLTPVQLDALLPELENLLNLALANLANSIIAEINELRGRTCAILNLELGPIDLTLLGLNVRLDDCEGGPVTVDITARRGQLLGNLLCGLLHGRGGNIDVGDTLQDILDAILDPSTP